MALAGAKAMRSVLALVLVLGLLITCSASADAATMHRFKPPARAHHGVAVAPSQRVTAPASFALPGWSDEQTREWLDNASRGSHEG
jgi:hypothetical protein